MKRGFLSAIAIAMLLGLINRTEVPARAQSTGSDALTFFKNYFITGDYVVGGVGLEGKGSGGLATGDIVISGVPAGADVLAAYLYWQVVTTDTAGSASGSAGATFNGWPLENPNGPVARVVGDYGTAPCWSSGGGTGSSGGSKKTYTYRADVLRFLNLDTDEDSPSYGEYLVNGSHTVQLPDSGNGNGTPKALGASLVIVYRDSSKPLSAVVIYDGSYTINNATPFLFQTIKGFYQAAATPNAKVTYIAGAGQSNKVENLYFNGTVVASNAFASTEGSSWDNPTFTSTSLPIPISVAENASQVTTKVDTTGLSGSDCLTWGAIIFKTDVKDTDDDGLLDVWETNTGALLDPNDRPLPPLGSMGALPNRKDLFVELGYMTTNGAALSYDKWDSATGMPVSTLALAHTHLPSAEALQVMADAFWTGPQRIAVHFDIGSITDPASPYSAGLYTGAQPAVGGGAVGYIVPSGVARGGEWVDETDTVCTRAVGDPPWMCQFSGNPGTVGWKTGFRYVRDEILGGAPGPTTDDEEDVCETPGSYYFTRDGLVPGAGAECERRFDRVRKDMFHYAFFSHALGLPRAEMPCLNPSTGDPTGVDPTTFLCFAGDVENPEFRIPKTTSGVGDFPGGDVLVSLGGFPDLDGRPTGTPFMQASTLMHELGHNFERRHSGETSTPAVPNPNCKPTYLSVMNYLYQLRGLLNDLGVPNLDYSRAVGPTLDEGSLTDGVPAGSPYRLGWYAPYDTSYLAGRDGTAPARSHCDGSAIPRDPTSGALLERMVRIDARTAAGTIDWNANGAATESGQTLDINFNGRTTVKADGSGGSEQLRGSDDWANLKLNQLGSRRSVGGFWTDADGVLRMGAVSLDMGRVAFGLSDLARTDYGRVAFGRVAFGRVAFGEGDLGLGDFGRVAFGRVAFGQVDFGRVAFGRVAFGRVAFGRVAFGNGDLGLGDFGGGDFFQNDPNNKGGELDAETAGDLAKTPPNNFRACVIGETCTPDPATPLHDVKIDFVAPNIGGVTEFQVYRIEGLDLTGAWTLVASVPVTDARRDYSVVDDDELKAGQDYTYFAVAIYPGPVQSDPSNFAEIVGYNDPLAAGDDTYTTDEDTALVVDVPQGVLDNDGDPDSSLTDVTAVLVTGPLHGTLVLNADGSFTYTPDANYNGSDSFTYLARTDAEDSNEATVTLNITAVNDVPVATGESYTTLEDTPLDVGAAAGVLDNDTDADKDALSAVLVGGPSHGTLTLNADGSFTYTPNANYFGPDSFTYKASDGTADSNVATVSITITAANDAPVANGQSVTTAEDTAKAITLGTTDVDGDTLTYAIVAGPAHGTLSGTAPALTYTPAANYNGADSFTFKVNDGTVDSNVATVSITITAVNDAPVAVNDAYAMPQGTALTIAAPGVLANDTDVDSALTAAVVSGPSHGVLVLNADGSFTYTPTATHWGTDTFTYRAWDGAAGSTATVTITVNRLVYGFVGVQNLPPQGGKSFNVGSAVPLKWQFTVDGVAVNSINAMPDIRIYNSSSQLVYAGTPEDPGSSSFQPPSASNGYTWQFNWQTKDLLKGPYSVYIFSRQTGQSFGPFTVTLK